QHRPQCGRRRSPLQLSEQPAHRERQRRHPDGAADGEMMRSIAPPITLVQPRVVATKLSEIIMRLTASCAAVAALAGLVVPAAPAQAADPLTCRATAGSDAKA